MEIIQPILKASPMKIAFCMGKGEELGTEALAHLRIEPYIKIMPKKIDKI